MVSVPCPRLSHSTLDLKIHCSFGTWARGLCKRGCKPLPGDRKASFWNLPHHPQRGIVHLDFHCRDQETPGWLDDEPISLPWSFQLQYSGHHLLCPNNPSYTLQIEREVWTCYHFFSSAFIVPPQSYHFLREDIPRLTEV